MKLMFMKEARLTSVEIKHYCLWTELLAVWVHTEEPANALQKKFNIPFTKCYKYLTGDFYHWDQQ